MLAFAVLILPMNTPALADEITCGPDLREALSAIYRGDGLGTPDRTHKLWKLTQHEYAASCTISMLDSQHQLFTPEGSSDALIIMREEEGGRPYYGIFFRSKDWEKAWTSGD